MVREYGNSPSAVRVVFTDASETGFGGYTIEHGCHIAHSQWTQQEMHHSSTWRELAAVISAEGLCKEVSQ